MVEERNVAYAQLRVTKLSGEAQSQTMKKIFPCRVAYNLCSYTRLFSFDIESSKITSQFLMQNVLWVWNVCYLANIRRDGDAVSVNGTLELMKLFPCCECIFGA